MLRDAVGYTCEVKTAQETAKESGGISRNHWKIGGNWGEIRGKLVNFGEIGGKFWGNWEKIGELCFPNLVKQNSQTVKSIPPTTGKKGVNERKLFHKNSPQWNLCETGGGNEREFCFHDQFQLHSTVQSVMKLLHLRAMILVCVTWWPWN